MSEKDEKFKYVTVSGLLLEKLCEDHERSFMALRTIEENKHMGPEEKLIIIYELIRAMRTKNIQADQMNHKQTKYLTLKELEESKLTRIQL